jgi:hypothetical protein
MIDMLIIAIKDIDHPTRKVPPMGRGQRLRKDINRPGKVTEKLGSGQKACKLWINPQ